MSFGSDTPGGSVEGIGGREEGIGGGFGGGGRDDVRELEKLFAQQIDPLMSARYGTVGNFLTNVGGYALGGLLNMVAPGLGTIANLTGLTGDAADYMRDAMVSREIAGMMGLSGDYNSVPETIEAAYKAGKTDEDIGRAYNQASERRGGAMGLWEDITGKSAAKAASGAAGTAASYQQQAIDYLKQMGAIPLAAQQGLAGIYGLPGGTGTQAQAIQAAKASPLYQSILGTREAGEEAIMRQAGATGGLRSGNVQEALYDYNTQLERDALTQAYGQQLQGLTGLAGLGTYAGDIASGLGGIGNTLAMGQTAAAQAKQQGTSNLIGLAGSAIESLGGVGGIVKSVGKLFGF